MAEQHHQKSSHESEPTVGGEGSVEAKDRGLFDFLGKKEEEKPQDQEVIASEFDQKVQLSEQHEPPKVEEPKTEETKVEEEKKPSLLEKLHRSGSSSSSSSDEEEGEGEEKKKKKKEKKGLKEKLKEKISGEKEEEKHEEDTAIPVEVVHQEPAESEEKKGFLDKIKEKLPGQHKKAEEVHSPTSPPPPPPPAEHHEAAPASHEGEHKEKKGIFEKIKEKLPGYHSKTEDEKEKEKEREKGSASD